jgi:DNA (cytosine-5)-methyltransferase 1
LLLGPRFVVTVYYNENDPKAAEWLRMLILMGEIAEGVVDERSIEDVTPGDIAGYTQCHFFAGIGGWSYALRLAGVPDTYRVWTGSCPCQPFSAAGKGKGFADERHLWPAWHWLVQQCRPQLIFGEQVASAMQWFDLVSADLEAEGYAAGAAVLGAHSVGAPHIRQRLYWVADNNNNNKAGFSKQRRSGLLNGKRSAQRDYVDGRGADGGMAHDDDERALGAASVGRVANAGSERRQQISGSAFSDEGAHGRQPHGNYKLAGHGENGGFWGAHRSIPCSDGKTRIGPIESEFQPLAHGVSGRVGLLRGYGNAIVPQVAAAFIKAYFQTRPVV